VFNGVLIFEKQNYERTPAGVKDGINGSGNLRKCGVGEI
jgi:hypothetical protein